MNSIAEWFAEAQKHHQAQRYPEAEAFYRRILDAEPSHLAAWYQLGIVCKDQKKLPQAEAAFQRFLKHSPNHIDALFQLGVILSWQNRLPEAIAKYRKIIELKPDHGPAHNNLGVVQSQLCRPDEALACYREAIRVQPDYAEAHFNLGRLYAERKLNEQAIASYKESLRLRPDHAELLNALGLLLVHEYRPAEAAVYLEQAVRLRPDHPDIYNHLSMALADLGRYEDAVAASDASLRARPRDARSVMNRGNALLGLGRNAEAQASYDLALLLQPDSPSVHWNLSLLQLVQGDYERGFKQYEWRFQRPETKVRNFPEPRLERGASLEGKTVLLWCEQGLGDIVQFVRYAELLKQRGATVWLECPPKMMGLLSTCRGIDRLVPEGAPLPAGFDYQAPLMSLPYICDTTLENVPAQTPYLSADPARVEHWRKELGKSPKFKIGVAWQGNPKHRWDLHRSFGLHWLKILQSVEGVELYSLQKNHGIEQVKTARFPIIDLGSQLEETDNAFVETAAVMKALDLVVTCDSALAHVAGALGVPVWVALSTPADWRWLEYVEDTPWYLTMWLFRQPKLGEWRPVFERMREEIIRLREGSSAIRLEVAPAELLDKLTILQIKAERITDADKLRNVQAELAVVEATRKQSIRERPGYADLVRELKEVNERLWDIENAIRVCEKEADFGEKFIGLARAVYQTNDQRADVKRRLNELLGAKFREEKEYHGANGDSVAMNGDSKRLLAGAS